MSLPAIPGVAGAAAGVKVPFAWVRAHPVVFVLLAILIGVLAIKFAPKFLALIGKVPLAGGKVVRFAQNQDSTTGA